MSKYYARIVLKKKKIVLNYLILLKFLNKGFENNTI